MTFNIREQIGLNRVNSHLHDVIQLHVQLMNNLLCATDKSRLQLCVTHVQLKKYRTNLYLTGLELSKH